MAISGLCSGRPSAQRPDRTFGTIRHRRWTRPPCTTWGYKPSTAPPRLLGTAGLWRTAVASGRSPRATTLIFRPPDVHGDAGVHNPDLARFELRLVSHGLRLFGVEVGKAASFALFPAAAVPGIADDQRDGERGFAKDHLLVRRIDLAPARGFFKRGAAEGAIAHVG